MAKLSFYVTILALGLTIFTACQKNEGPVYELSKTVVVKLAAQNELPAPALRTDNGTGTATLKLYSDNHLDYVINMGIYNPSDKITMAHIHTGDAGTNGPVSVTFDVTAANNSRNFGGSVQLTQAQADAIKAGTPQYVNVHSVSRPGGLVRGQLETDVLQAFNTQMFGNREVPIASTNAVGTAWVRITADNNVFSNINVVNLAVGESLTAAHIHTGAIRTNGPVLVNLLPGGVTDFGRTVKIPITQAQATSLATSPLYLNAHSTRFPGGVVRNQVRN
jgi:hypothetical protein